MKIPNTKLDYKTKWYIEDKLKNNNNKYNKPVQIYFLINIYILSYLKYTTIRFYF